ncbi:MAG: serine/threonine-protein kinase [Gemmatimonadales bacterium]
MSSGAGRVTTGSRPIPEDLLREASLRLGIIALLTAVLWIVATVAGHLAYRVTRPASELWAWFGTPDWIALVSAAASFGLFIYSRRTKRDPKFILNLGLIYMVLTSIAIALLAHWDPEHSAVALVPNISWIGVMVLIFAAIVPSSAMKTVVAGFICAAMNPLSMLIASWRGAWDFGPKIGALAMHYPDFLLVGVAVVISRVVTKLGQQVGRAREMGSYKLGELIKRGGMGEVYRAEHRMLARPAAIKLIRPEMLVGHGEESTIAVKRFYREAEAAATLRSPHTVELFDFGVTEDETLYFVMELLDGLDLETMVRQHGVLPASRVVHILRQVCESLEEAHVRGLVHRDIKPANIHVGRVGLMNDFVKVLDFGLVKTVSNTSEHSLGTEVGRTPGTPAYMAPEMALGEIVDGRTDIYALGCVAYYLLSARLVFDAENTFQMVAKHLRNDPVPPSLKGGVDVPYDLERLVLSCLAKKPEARPQTAGDLSRALAQLKVAPWTDTQARAWWTSIQSNAPAAATSPRSPEQGPGQPELRPLLD